MRTTAGNSGTEDLNNFRNTTAFLDSAVVTVHYSAATHYR
jgi:hypothetical protein